MDIRVPEGMEHMLQGLIQFLDEWTVDPNNVKPLFITLLEHTKRLSDVRVRYIRRPGISHSVRLVNSAQQDGGFFGLMDVVDDDPENRWLSVCFYSDMITDHAGKGDYIPGGIGGNDSTCFSVDHPEGFEDYLKDRITEACIRSYGVDPESKRKWKLC